MDLNAPDAPQFASATARVDAKKAGLRIQEALPGMFPEVLPSRKSCRKALDRGDILLNGVVADTARRVQIGDTVTLNVALQPPTPPGKGNPDPISMAPTPGCRLLVCLEARRPQHLGGGQPSPGRHPGPPGACRHPRPTHRPPTPPARCPPLAAARSQARPGDGWLGLHCPHPQHRPITWASLCRAHGPQKIPRAGRGQS